ncbi:hypothetical protein CCYA_CCYA19G4626 [Cyanidiococcus yangmingshanensis]|nr:hypothetical protein CCYA_CCYA19G4626 [Cyanidiococcus yangmingshanensis]
MATAAWLAVGLVSTDFPTVVECVLVWDRQRGRLFGADLMDRTNVDEPLARGQKLLQTAPNDAEYAQVELDLWADCLAGVADLCLNEYLVLVTESQHVGALFDATIVPDNPIHVYRVHKFVVWPIRSRCLPDASAMEERKQIEEKLMQLLQKVLRLPNYYYSPQWDITQRLQQTCFKWDKRSRPSSRCPDERKLTWTGNAFTWNARLMRNLLQRMREADTPSSRIHALVRPILFGFVELFRFRCTSADGSIHQAQYALISRCSRFRAGVRFFRRGADTSGHVANFVETESVIQSGERLTSHVQVRGSVPLQWRQPPTLHYKPIIRFVGDEKETQQAFDRHFERLSARYEEPVVVVDLVNQRGSEGTLQQRYAMEALRRRIPYIAWDFHHECKGMRYERVHDLIVQLERILLLQGVFTADVVHRRIIQRQRGVIRTNCIDCLDRTNVVQSAIASRMITVQLHALGLDGMDDQLEFRRQFNGLWADHADAMANYYAGSAALKTDFTRTGRRSLSGTLKDGWSAARRYVINNGYDGHRQDAVDVLLGNFDKDAAMLSGLLQRERRRTWRRLLTLVLVVSIGTFIYALLWSRQRVGISSVVLFLIAYRLALSHGTAFVDQPRLWDSERVATKSGS